jgi:hypothetical protein
MARVGIRMDERGMRDFGRRILRMVSAAPAANVPLDRLVVKSEVQPDSYGPISTGSKLPAEPISGSLEKRLGQSL